MLCAPYWITPTSIPALPATNRTAGPTIILREACGSYSTRLNARPDFADCDPLVGDEFERDVSWRGSADLSGLAGKKITVRFEMMRATLFAWEFGRPGAARQST